MQCPFTIHVKWKRLFRKHPTVGRSPISTSREDLAGFHLWTFGGRHIHQLALTSLLLFPCSTAPWVLDPLVLQSLAPLSHVRKLSENAEDIEMSNVIFLGKDRMQAICHYSWSIIISRTWPCMFAWLDGGTCRQRHKQLIKPLKWVELPSIGWRSLWLLSRAALDCLKVLKCQEMSMSRLRWEYLQITISFDSSKSYPAWMRKFCMIYRFVA